MFGKDSGSPGNDSKKNGHGFNLSKKKKRHIRLRIFLWHNLSKVTYYHLPTSIWRQYWTDLTRSQSCTSLKHTDVHSNIETNQMDTHIYFYVCVCVYTMQCIWYIHTHTITLIDRLHLQIIQHRYHPLKSNNYRWQRDRKISSSFNGVISIKSWKFYPREIVQ